MKKFKIIVLTVMCAFCLCFAFAGCSGGSYVKNSFDCEISEYGTSQDKIEISFEIKINDYQDYRADYVITIKSKDGKITDKYGYYRTLGKPVEGKVTVTDSLYIYRSDYGEDGYIVELASLRVYKNNREDKSVGYAIGFGVVGGLLLCGITAYFIADKLVLSKKNKD